MMPRAKSTRVCEVIECGRKHVARGYCSLHWQRLKFHGDATAVVKSSVHHGLSDDPIYWCWLGIKRRCFNRTSKDYPNYGGRGITMCDRWRFSFENFVKDMGVRSDGLSIDRIDVNGNYEPGNCRWATRAEQNQNRRDSLRHNGLSAREWAERLGVSYGTFRSYVQRHDFVLAIEHYKTKPLKEDTE